MSKSLLLILFLVPAIRIYLAQLSLPTQHLFAIVGTLNANDQNQQNLNPAALHPTDTFACRFFVSSPLRVANLAAANAFLYYRKKQLFLFHEIGGLFQAAQSHFFTNHALALQLNHKISMGIGIQLKAIFQPKPYGSFLSGSAILGFQYKIKPSHQLALVIYDIGHPQQQLLRLEHVALIRANLFFAQGFVWNPIYQPTWYCSIIQKTTQHRLQFSCGLFPQCYSFSFEGFTHHKITWVLAQSWQNGLGLGLQMGIIVR
ncbi:MAG: hypothetical protein RL511_552 [Bacteroidota bacterium]|jgi:hypothetical protein